MLNMYSSIIGNFIHYAWPPVLLLSILWTILALIFFFVRFQLKKEKQEQLENQPTNSEKEAFSKEIDELALYVSRLPRPVSMIREFRNEEMENGND
jgi:hypothetical protein